MGGAVSGTIFKLKSESTQVDSDFTIYLNHSATLELFPRLAAFELLLANCLLFPAKSSDSA